MFLPRNENILKGDQFYFKGITLFASYELIYILSKDKRFRGLK